MGPFSANLFNPINNCDLDIVLPTLKIKTPRLRVFNPKGIKYGSESMSSDSSPGIFFFLFYCKTIGYLQKINVGNYFEITLAKLQCLSNHPPVQTLTKPHLKQS